MEISDKLKRIRERLHIPQKVLAIEMRCSAALISRIEKGNIAISNHMLVKMRESLDITDVPLTTTEIIEFEKELCGWRDIINDGRIEEAREALPRLARSAEFSLEPDLQILYALISVGYYRVVGENDSADEALTMLSSIKDKFSLQNLFRYYSLLGTEAANARDYKTALRNCQDAECLGESLNMIPPALFYHIAVCFTNLGYFYQSEDYIMKARKRAEETNQKVFGVYFDSLQALNFNEMGKQAKALDLLMSCLRREKKMGKSSMFDTLYHNIGCIHLKLKDFDMAIDYFNQCFMYCKEGSRIYIDNLYFMINALFAANRNTDAEQLLDKGLEKSSGDELLSLMFDAVKHSRKLNDEESLSFMEDIVIPELLAKGFHLKAIEYCDILRNYFIKVKKYKHALKYSMMSQYYYKKIMEGDLT